MKPNNSSSLQDTHPKGKSDPESKFGIKADLQADCLCHCHFEHQHDTELGCVLATKECVHCKQAPEGWEERLDRLDQKYDVIYSEYADKLIKDFIRTEIARSQKEVAEAILEEVETYCESKSSDWQMETQYAKNLMNDIKMIILEKKGREE